MKKLLSVLLSAVLIISVFSGCSQLVQSTFCLEQEELDADVRIVSFNVAAPWGNAIKKTGSNARVQRFAIYMNAVHADSIGTQEMNSVWMEKLTELMPEYDSYGVQRGGDDSEEKSEMNTIFWLKDKYDCVDKNTFWLSETPDTESRYEGAGCHRVCSYVVLENKSTGDRYIHLNTHLDNASDEARVFGAGVILEKIDELKQTYNDIPIVLSGDFNDYLDGPAAKQLAAVFNAEDSDKNTYHDWGNITDGKPIDFIFTSGEIISYEILNNTDNGYISDHYGIYQAIQF